MRNLLTLLSIVALYGCATVVPEFKAFTISGGEVVQLPVARGGMLPSENRDIRIEVAGFMVDKEKKELVYAFGFTEKNRSTPRKVVVEDVTGSVSATLVSDDNPALSASGYWIGHSMPKNAGDPSISWVYTTGGTEKIFRFSIITSDGRSLVMYQGAAWSGAAKSPLATMLR